jgi:hypothetical protein
MPAVDPSKFLDDLGRLLGQLESKHTRLVSGRAELNHIRSVVGTWFQYRPTFSALLGDEKLLLPMDGRMEAAMELAIGGRARTTVVKAIRGAHRCYTDTLLVPLTRANWSRAPQRTPAGRDSEVTARLRKLDPGLADSYEQAVRDLDDDGRITYKGPAAELREVLTGVLHKLAPTAEVQATPWYQQARRTGVRSEPTPTRVERTKFIMRHKGKGSAAEDAAESSLALVEDRLGKVVDATYRMGAAATHEEAEREEVRQTLRYLNALLRELS